MLNMNSLKNQRGFSILEVLFAMVVLSIALLSVARMHALVTLDGGYSKARGIAVNLAQEKLDDLRAFTSINTGCTAPVFCFTEIGNNTGGRENSDGTLVIPSGDVPVGNTTYNRTWVVTNYYRCGTSAPSTTNCTSPYTKAYPDFKVVVVTVTWTDEQGTLRSVVMDATIHSAGIVSEANVLATPYGGGGPKVSYHPIGVPDAVPVPVNVGGNQQKETSKPLPDVSTSGQSKVVSFDVVTYNTNESLGGGTYKTLRREQFYTVNCVCEYKSGTSNQRTASRLVWDNTDLVPEIGAKTDKAWGAAHRTGTNSDPNQPAQCDICCRDHHDSASSDYAKYDPERDPDTDYYTSGNAQGDHKHYWWTSVGHPELGLTAVAGNDGDVYLEACRFSKVNGIDYLWQDWRMVDMTVFDYNFLQDADNLTAYQEYLVDKVEHEAKADGIAAGATITATTDPAKPTGRGITISQGSTRQLLGRTLYLDEIYKKNSPTELDNDYYAAINSKITGGEDWLLYVPFYEANSTLLIDWRSNNAGVPVTMEQVDTILDPNNYYLTAYNRGLVTGATAGQTGTITARALVSNSGLTSGVYANTGVSCSSPYTAVNCYSYGIDPADNSTVKEDSITVTVGSAGVSQHIVSGTILLGAGGGGAGLGTDNQYTVTASNSGNCTNGATVTIAGVTTVLGASVGASSVTYHCVVPNNWTGVITPTRTNYEFDAIAGDGSHTPARTISTPVTSGLPGEDFQMCKTACTNP